jgi:hypothetical protein
LEGGYRFVVYPEILYRSCHLVLLFRKRNKIPQVYEPIALKQYSGSYKLDNQKGLAKVDFSHDHQTQEINS